MASLVGSFLRVREEEVTSGSAEGGGAGGCDNGDGGVEATLAAARGLVARGRFLEGAALLERRFGLAARAHSRTNSSCTLSLTRTHARLLRFGGTAAAAAVGDWTRAARVRARVDQAVMVLEATAATKARSLS